MELSKGKIVPRNRWETVAGYAARKAREDECLGDETELCHDPECVSCGLLWLLGDRSVERIVCHD